MKLRSRFLIRISYHKRHNALERVKRGVSEALTACAKNGALNIRNAVSGLYERILKFDYE